MLYSSGTTGQPKGVWRPAPGAPIEQLQPADQALAGAFQIDVGDTLDLTAEANYPNARFSATPLVANAAFEQVSYSFTPAPGQEGVYSVLFATGFYLYGNLTATLISSILAVLGIGFLWVNRKKL